MLNEKVRVRIAKATNFWGDGGSLLSGTGSKYREVCGVNLSGHICKPRKKH